MFRARIFLLLFVFIYFAGQAWAQSTEYNKKDILKLTDKADKYLTDYNFKESLLYSREALKQAIYIKDDYLIATAYNTIAGNFDELSEPDKAIFNYKKALFYASRTDNDSIKGWINNNLGNVYFFEKKDYELGINYYQKAIEYAEKTADTSKLVLTNLNIALGYFEVGNFEKGYPYLEYINKHHAKYGGVGTIVYLNMLNGSYCGHIKQNEKAEYFFANAIGLAKKHNQKADLAYTYQAYSKFLMAIEDYKRAYRYLALYDQLKDEIYNTEKLKKADVEGVNFEIDEYKRALDKIESEKEAQSLSLKKSRIIVVLFVVVLVVLLLLLYTLLKNNNFKKKTNTELTAANEELLIANKRAEEASRLKTQFVSTISHELRTPLYGVVGITNMILDEHKELSDSPHLNSLKFSARYLLSLVNDILQINKIEEKRVVLETLAFNISDEIDNITNSLQFIANKNENKIIVDTDPAIPEFLIGDKLRLSQVLVNLASNALKFTKKGEIRIITKQLRIENSCHYIEFTISDNGVGIAKEDQDKIFEKFVQIGRRDDDYQGTGLGLSIVKRLIELFDSEIHLESKPNVGTTFSFTIGFEADDKKTTEIINNIEVDLTSSQIFSILVVEDNKINQMVTKKILEKNNFKCDIAEDGLLAIEMLDRKEYDVILMDINMPIINGFETTRRLRAKGIKTPVIALTAFDKDEITEESISSGINDIIIKPFEPVKMFQIINSQISKSKNAG